MWYHQRIAPMSPYLPGIAHWAPVLLVPLLWTKDRVRVLIVLSLLVSVIADSAVDMGVDTWLVTYIYPVFQLGLVAYALIPSKVFRNLFMAGILTASVLSFMQGPLDSPEVVVRVSGALLLTAIVWKQRQLGYMRSAIVVYFGIGSIFRAMFPLFMTDVTSFLVVWYGYQTSRLAGVGYLLASVFQRPRLKVVPGG